MSQVDPLDKSSGESQVNTTENSPCDPQSLPKTTKSSVDDPQSLLSTTEKSTCDTGTLPSTTEMSVVATTVTSVSNESQNNAADQYFAAPDPKGSKTDVSSEEVKLVGQETSQEDHQVKYLGDPVEQTSAKVFPSEQEAQADTQDKSVELKEPLTTTVQSGQQELQTGTGMDSGDPELQSGTADKFWVPGLPITETCNAQSIDEESQMGTSHKSGDLDVQMPPTEVSTEQAAQTGTADKSSDQESQNGNVCNESLEEQKSHANVCSASTTDIESTAKSWKSDIDKGTSGHESGEKVLESCFPGGPRQRGPKHNPAEPNSLSRESKDKKCLREEVTDSWTSTKAKSGWSQSQETNAASLEEEKSESHVTDKDMGADICDGDKELQKCSIEKGGTDTLRTRPQTWSGAKPKSPTSTDELDSPASNSSKKNKAPRYLLMGCLIALALASVPSIISWMQRPPVHHDNVVERFLREFASVKSDFPGQYDGLWFRSEKLLQKHVNTSDPSAPSILILTAARDGERTLRCVSERIAKSYAIAHNASWFLVSGPSKSKYDSATSKMQIDNELSSGFQVGNSRAAVLYRLETLPAGSLLILYKYCDHENAAFKKVSLVLPILLDEQSLETDLSFPEVEEKVKDLLWERFANSDVIAHNEMDVDKLSGVWSRISHVVLPVLPVDYVESGQCPGTKD